MWLLDKMLKALIRKGQLVITDYNGREYRYGDPQADPIRLRFTDKGAAAHIAKDPPIGAGETYMDGRLLVEAPHDIRDMVLLVMSQPKAQQMGPRGPWRRFADRIASRLDQRNQRRAPQHPRALRPDAAILRAVPR